MNPEIYLEKLGKAERKYPWTFIAAMVVLTFVLLSGFSLISTETAFSDALPDDIEVLDAMIIFGNEFGVSTQNIMLVYQIDMEDEYGIDDIRDARVMKSLENVLNKADTLEDVVSTSSVLDVIKEDGFVPSNTERIKKLIDDSPFSSRFVNSDYRILVSSIIIEGNIEQQDMFDLVADIQQIVSEEETPPGVVIKLAGDPVEQVEINNAIGTSVGFTTLLGFLGVFVILYLFFRRPSRVILAVFPVIFATLWTFGTMGLLGIPMSSMLSGIFSMIIGIGIDFGIHILHRYDEEVKLKVKDPIVETVKHIGKGLFLTTITTTIGFLALLSATLKTMGDLGIVLSFGIIYSFIVSVVLIPSLLVISERRKSERRKK